MTNDTFDSTCLRHPDVASNLSCGRCGDLICPQCMVQSPVGARCPECANIGQAPIFRATSGELTRTIGIALLGAIGFGVAFALAGWVLKSLSTSELSVSFRVASIVMAAVIGFSGRPVGDIVRKAGRYKLDKRLRTVAALTMLVAWVVSQVLANFLNVPILLFTNIVSVIGLGIGVYIAMNRVRP